MNLNELYDMTIKELILSLENRRKGLAYKIWKQAYLIGVAFAGKKYPRTPEEASPELYPKKKTIPMPKGLLGKLGG